MKPFATSHQGGFTLRIRLTPRAAKNAVGGVHVDEKGDEWLKVSVTTVPEKGKANGDLVGLLSKTLKIRKGAFRLVSGETDRNKIFEVSEVCDAARLTSLATPSAS